MTEIGKMSAFLLVAEAISKADDAHRAGTTTAAGSVLLETTNETATRNNMQASLAGWASLANPKPGDEKPRVEDHRHWVDRTPQQREHWSVNASYATDVANWNKAMSKKFTPEQIADWGQSAQFLQTQYQLAQTEGQAKVALANQGTQAGTMQMRTGVTNEKPILELSTVVTSVESTLTSILSNPFRQ